MREKENRAGDSKGSKGVLVVDAGDLFFKKTVSPVPEGDLKMAAEKAHLIVESMNLMGCDAVGIGDDDLTLGKEFLLELSKKAKFPFLASNVFDEGSGKPLFQPYVIKEISGLRIGIFGLLSPDVFSGASDFKKKGLIFRPTAETAQQIVKELQPKTDLILLLSHLGYQKDLELAQAVQGIHIIAGGHTGMSLSYPPASRSTVILQTAPRGMYVGRVDFTAYRNEPVFYNVAMKRNLENTLNRLERQITSPDAKESQRAQWLRSKDEFERRIKELQGKNEYFNAIIPLGESIKDHPGIGKLIESFKLKYPDPEKPSPPKQ